MMDPKSSETAANRNWVRRLEPGETLFKEGDTDRRVYVLLEGRVEVLKDDRVLAEVGVAESFIGEISALTGKPRWATVRTTVPCMMLVVERVEDLFGADSTWGLKLARVLADRLDRTNERLKRVQSLLDETRERELDSTLVRTMSLELEGVSLSQV